MQTPVMCTGCQSAMEDSMFAAYLDQQVTE